MEPIWGNIGPSLSPLLNSLEFAPRELAEPSSPDFSCDRQSYLSSHFPSAQLLDDVETPQFWFIVDSYPGSSFPPFPSSDSFNGSPPSSSSSCPILTASSAPCSPASAPSTPQLAGFSRHRHKRTKLSATTASPSVSPVVGSRVKGISRIAGTMLLLQTGLPATRPGCVPEDEWEHMQMLQREGKLVKCVAFDANRMILVFPEWYDFLIHHRINYGHSPLPGAPKLETVFRWWSDKDSDTMLFTPITNARMKSAGVRCIERTFHFSHASALLTQHPKLQLAFRKMQFAKFFSMLAYWVEAQLRCQLSKADYHNLAEFGFAKTKKTLGTLEGDIDYLIQTCNLQCMHRFDFQ